MAQQTRRYMLDYDESQQPPVGTDAVAEIFSGLIDVHSRGGNILEKKDPITYPSSDIIVVRQGTIVALFNSLWRTFEVHQDIELGIGDLDTGGSFIVGTDYYVYLVDDNAGGLLVISANSTFPAGAAADSSRKLGGFHYGHIRCVGYRNAPIDSNGVVFGVTGTIWQNNVVVGIVPNSVWDLKNRPACSPEGMVRIGSRWVDIYLSSAAESISYPAIDDNFYTEFIYGGLLQSKYGQPISTATWYAFQELAVRSGKRLQTYAEFVQSAAGNPGGSNSDNNYGWTTTSNLYKARTGCGVNPTTGLYDPVAGVKPYAVSAYNVVDTVGNLAEWVDDVSIFDNGSTSVTWRDTLGQDKGWLYAYTAEGLHAFCCGGQYDAGIHCGARTVDTTRFPTLFSIGSRLTCRSLVT
jgi:hypothetical protein